MAGPRDRGACRCCARRSRRRPARRSLGQGLRLGHGRLRAELNGEPVGDQHLAPGLDRLPQAHPAPDLRRDRPGPRRCQRLRRRARPRLVGRQGRPVWPRQLRQRPRAARPSADRLHRRHHPVGRHRRQHVEERLGPYASHRQHRRRDLRRPAGAAGVATGPASTTAAGTRVGRGHRRTRARSSAQPDEPVADHRGAAGPAPHRTRRPASTSTTSARTWSASRGWSCTARPARPSRSATARSSTPTGRSTRPTCAPRRSTDSYTFDADGTATYKPTFTQHGFRYVEISGTTRRPALADVTGVVWGSDLTATGELETSDPMLNQLLSNISWGQRGNFLSIPTDTPARDERLGWTGDISVFAPTASYLRDTRAFLAKWMTDLRRRASTPTATSRPSRPAVPATIGESAASAGPTRASPCRTPLWQAYGDATDRAAELRCDGEVLRLRPHQWPDADLIEDRSRHVGRLAATSTTRPRNGVLGTAYFAQDARMMSEMAAAIGKTADAAEFASSLPGHPTGVRRRRTSRPTAPCPGNSQTGYAMALGMGLVPDRAEGEGRREVRRQARGQRQPPDDRVPRHPVAAARAERGRARRPRLTAADAHRVPVVGLRGRRRAPPRCGSAGTRSSPTAASATWG